MVYLALHLRLQKYVVIKRILTNHQDSPSLRVETDILKNLHHPSLPQIYDFIVQEGEVYTVIDYVEGRDFSQLGCGIGVIDPQMMMKWFRDLMEVLEYMHTRQHPIIHSDIKPANIMLRPNGDICLIDFNISLEGNQQGMIMGYSDVFASPEQVQLALAYTQGTPLDYTLDARTDLYSVAATMYYMMTGILPNIYGQFPKLTEIDGLPYPQGFLVILDRCLSIDRNQRYSSATKVLKALDNLKKLDIRYRRYLLIQAATWIGCAALISLGVFFIIRGTQKNTEDLYRSRYNEFYNSAVSGSDMETINIGYELLNESKYSGIFEKNPSDKAMIFHTIGEAYYRMGDYQGAAETFAEATRSAEVTDVNLGNYYLDYAMALAECGDYNEARNKILLAGNSVSRGSVLLIDAKIAAQSGDSSQCAELVSQILSLPGSAEECAEGCLLAAQSIGVKTTTGIAWMEKALTYKQSTEVLRPLASNCLAIVSDFDNRNEKNTWVEKAIRYYAMLVNMSDATDEDRLGYGMSLYVAGKNAECVQVLRNCAERGTNDYRIYLYLALAYAQMKDSASASAYCRTAMGIVSSMTDEERSRADGGMLQKLAELAAELDVNAN